MGSMQQLDIVLPGVPKPKARARFMRRGDHVVTFDPQKADHEALRWLIKEKVGNFVPIAVAVEIDAVFYLPIPKSASKKRRGLMECGEIRHTKKPDGDNLFKNLLDCMNGIIFDDDRQVDTFRCLKVYGEEPRTEITVRWNA